MPLEEAECPEARTAQIGNSVLGALVARTGRGHGRSSMAGSPYGDALPALLPKTPVNRRSKVLATNSSLVDLRTSSSVDILAVADPKHEVSFLCSGVDDTIVPHAKFVQSRELSRQGFPSVAL